MSADTNLPGAEVVSQSCPVSLPTKLLFWLILGTLSVELAEVVSSSDPFPFFHLWGLIVTFPVYALHVLVLAYFVFGRKKATLPSLFLAGAILGMYEAYLTKVLWNPTWGESFTLQAGGVYVIQTAVLVLFWHPLLAFVLPVFFAENLFTSSSETFDALPRFAQKALRKRPVFFLAVVAFAVFGGIYQSGALRTLRLSLLSGASATAALFLLGGLWRWVRRGRSLSLRDVLPSKRQAAVLGAFLLVMYIVMGALLRRDALPRTLTPHLTVGGMYAILIALLYFNLKHSSPWTGTGPSAIRDISVQTGLVLGGVFTLTSALFGLVGGNVKMVVVFGSWVVGCALGAALLIEGVVNAFRPGRRHG